jgi:hypothetical protein
VKAVPPNDGHTNNDHDGDNEISIVMCGRSGYLVRESVRERARGSDDPQPYQTPAGYAEKAIEKAFHCPSPICLLRSDCHTKMPLSITVVISVIGKPPTPPELPFLSDGSGSVQP